MTTARTPMPSDVDADALAQLIDDARRLPAAMLPRPRRAPVVDLTVPQPRITIRIPSTTASLVDGYEDNVL